MFACDEIYNHVEFEGKARSLSEWLPDDSFCYSGMSKWAGSGGWRLGYLLIPEKHMKLKYEI